MGDIQTDRQTDRKAEMKKMHGMGHADMKVTLQDTSIS
jgi:hypothetical protein